jgi:membrane protease YdiL (CAAX protease family)
MEKPRLKKKLWGPWATAGLGLAVIAVFLIIQVLVVVVYAIITAFSQPGLTSPAEFLNILLARLGLLTALATCISAVICLGLIILFIRARKGASIVEYLGLKRITVKNILVALAIVAGLIILSDGISLLLGRPLQTEDTLNIYRTSIWPALIWIAFVVFGPIFEETLFRGFLFEGFRQSRIGPIGAIGLTALSWALIHIPSDFYDIAVIFVAGILLGIVRLKTGSLWTPLIMHAFANIVATLETVLIIKGLIG